MKSFRFACIISWFSLGCSFPNSAAEPLPNLEYAIAIHGGAIFHPGGLSDAEQEQQRKSLAQALDVGRKILADGGDSLDAVEQTIRAMEDDPTFNAGRGAVFNSIGKHELDASIMDGRKHQAGAVAAVATVKNPISLARLVMTQTRYVLLAGEGAEKFADEMRANPKIERVPNTYFDTDSQRKKWLKEPPVGNALRGVPRTSKKMEIPLDARNSAEGVPYGVDHGTVGCVALDKKGNLAAGTSTGGLSNKRWGRVGDSPIIGAGAYADNATCAVSCTGIGEHFIRHCVAFHISALMAYRNLSVDAATRQIVKNVLEPNTGGVIVMDRAGRISFRFNTPGMARAATDSSGKVLIELK
jgi:L-asparaginase / beta-aspartyl-peptidase